MQTLSINPVCTLQLQHISPIYNKRCVSNCFHFYLVWIQCTFCDMAHVPVHCAQMMMARTKSINIQTKIVYHFPVHCISIEFAFFLCIYIVRLPFGLITFMVHSFTCMHANTHTHTHTRYIYLYLIKLFARPPTKAYCLWQTIECTGNESICNWFRIKLNILIHVEKSNHIQFHHISRSHRMVSDGWLARSLLNWCINHSK